MVLAAVRIAQGESLNPEVVVEVFGGALDTLVASPITFARTIRATLYPGPHLGLRLDSDKALPTKIG